MEILESFLDGAYMKGEETGKLKLIIYLIVLAAVLSALFNIPSQITDLVIQWLMSAFVGSVCALVAGSLVETFTGNILKTISLTISIKGFNMSISAFAISTSIVRIWLFGF